MDGTGVWRPCEGYWSVKKILSQVFIEFGKTKSMFEDIEKMGFAHFGIGAHEGSWTAGDNRYVNEFVEQFEHYDRYRSAIFELLSHLESFKSRKVLVEKYIFFKDNNLIAQRMGCSVRTVKRLHKLAIGELVEKCHGYLDGANASVDSGPGRGDIE